MSLITMSQKKRPILITGKSGTGKTTLAKQVAGDAYLLFYADELEDRDWKSIPSNIIVEDVHYKPNKDVIMTMIRQCRGLLVFTSINEKDIPKDIKNACRIKRAGTRPFLREQIKIVAPRSEEPDLLDKTIAEIIHDYMKNSDRDAVADMLKHNRPVDTQIMTWLGININPNKIAFIDAKVRRRWSSDYFYEMLAYVHDGRAFTRTAYPKRGVYSKVPFILKKLRIKPSLGHLLPQLLKDEDFSMWAKNRLVSSEKRIIGIKERVKRNAPITPDRTLRLDRWF
jgi:hypothetical protein